MFLVGNFLGVTKMTMNLGTAAITVYFVMYPIFYFGFNHVVESVGYSQYAIPSFWLGMLALLVIRIGKSLIFFSMKDYADTTK